MTQNHKLSLNNEREFNCCKILELKNVNTWCLCLFSYKNGMSSVFSVITLLCLTPDVTCVGLNQERPLSFTLSCSWTFILVNPLK